MQLLNKTIFENLKNYSELDYYSLKLSNGALDIKKKGLGLNLRAIFKNKILLFRNFQCFISILHFLIQGLQIFLAFGIHLHTMFQSLPECLLFFTMFPKLGWLKLCRGQPSEENLFLLLKNF